MARFVVEPAIAVKWFLPEEYSNPAARLLDGGNELMAPDTLLFDAGRLITAKVRLGELSPDEGTQIVRAVQSVPVKLQPSQPLLEPALRIAASLDLPLGDGLGLAVAVHGDCRLVTAGRTLYEKVQGTPFAVHVKWVGDIR
jgi:predicted nucleic acid-binding protein